MKLNNAELHNESMLQIENVFIDIKRFSNEFEDCQVTDKFEKYEEVFQSRKNSDLFEIIEEPIDLG